MPDLMPSRKIQCTVTRVTKVTATGISRNTQIDVSAVYSTGKP